MKGLLLKDFDLTKKYCRAYLLIVAVFLLISLVGDNNYFFLFYPCLISGMVPATLLGYDERSRWSVYCRTLPYTKAQIVSGKYLIGLIAQCVILVLTALIQAAKTFSQGTFDSGELLTLMALLVSMACISSALSLPFMFRYGVEKGRIAYFVTVGFVCGGSVVAQKVLNVENVSSSSGIIYLICLAAVVGYALSWYLSIVFYRKKENE